MRWLVAVSVAACGRYGFQPTAGDVLVDHQPPIDACVVGPWSTPVVVGGVNSTVDDYGPALSPDGSLLAFTTRRTGVLDLYVAQRLSATTFSAPLPIATVNTANKESGAAWSATGDQLYFTSDRVGGVFHLYRASYAAGVVSAPTVITELAAESLLGPTVTDRELFATEGSGPARIRVATRPSNAAPWSATALVTELSTGPADGFPSIARDGLTIYFQSTRLGPSHLFKATRPQIGATWSSPMQIVELASAADEVDAEISADDLTIVFGSTRAGGMGGYDLWISTRSCN